MTPLPLMVIVDPSTLTPPRTVVDAVGNVYCCVINDDKSGGVYVIHQFHCYKITLLYQLMQWLQKDQQVQTVVLVLD